MIASRWWPGAPLYTPPINMKTTEYPDMTVQEFDNRNVEKEVEHAEHSKVVLTPFELSVTHTEGLGGTEGDMRAELSVLVDPMCKKLEMKLCAWLAAEKHEAKCESYFFPKNAWQCLINDYAPAWYIKKFPVKYNELKVPVAGDVYVCPHMTVPRTPEDRVQHLKFIQQKN